MILPNSRRLKYERVDIQLHSFGILALDTSEWSALCSGCFTNGERNTIPLNRRLGGPQSQSGYFRKLITSVAPARNQL